MARRAKEGLRFSGSWIRASTVSGREVSPRGRRRSWLLKRVQDPGNGGSVTTPSSALLAALCPEWGHENEPKVQDSAVPARSRWTSLSMSLNPIGVQDSVVPCSGQEDGPRFRCPASRDSLPHHRVGRPGERKRGWTSDFDLTASTLDLDPPAARSALAAGDGLGS